MLNWQSLLRLSITQANYGGKEGGGGLIQSQTGIVCHSQAFIIPINLRLLT